MLNHGSIVVKLLRSLVVARLRLLALDLLVFGRLLDRVARTLLACCTSERFPRLGGLTGASLGGLSSGFFHINFLILIIYNFYGIWPLKIIKILFH